MLVRDRRIPCGTADEVDLHFEPLNQQQAQSESVACKNSAPMRQHENGTEIDLFVIPHLRLTVCKL